MEFFNDKYKAYLLVPAVLFVLFMIAIFFVPGISMGRDLLGGTSINIRGNPESIEVDSFKSMLENEYNLEDVKITVTTNGLGVEYAQNKYLGVAQKKINESLLALNSDPDQARQLAQEALNDIEPIYKPGPSKENDTNSFVEHARLSVVEAKKLFEKDLKNKIISSFGTQEIQFHSQEVFPTLGKLFWDAAVKVAIIGIIAIIAVIFLLFREFIPSAAVIGAATFDIVGALGLMAIFNVPLNLSSISALLMLIGYSVDTDIMLTTRLIKRTESMLPKKKAWEAMKTGLTMTGTTLASVTSMVIVSYFTQIPFIFEIAIVLLFGLLADLVSTWMMNAPVLLWYVEKKEASK